MGIDGEWDELEQVGFRKNIRELIEFRLPEEGFEERIDALSKLRAIVMEEIARAFRFPFSFTIEQSAKGTRADAQRLVTKISEALDRLGLAIKHPETEKPMKLNVVSGAPRPGESWLQLEPYESDRGTLPYRIPRPTIIQFSLCPAPLPSHGHRRGPPLTP